MIVEPTEPGDNVMRRWPMTIRIFLNHRMHCVGCPIACFHTVADACREHGVDQAKFLTELSVTIMQGPTPQDESAPVDDACPA